MFPFFSIYNITIYEKNNMGSDIVRILKIILKLSNHFTNSRSENPSSASIYPVSVIALT